VKISEFRVASAPAIFKISGLGSCVALALYDPQRKRGGLAHILLPGPAPSPAGAGHDSGGNPYKYADQAIAALLEFLYREGRGRQDLFAKIAGGANMFGAPDGFDKLSPLKASIGERNVEAVKQHLSALGIPLAGEETGGSAGRSVTFDVSTGEMLITNANGQSRKI
jgi:chemotaxis protein CheD